MVERLAEGLGLTGGRELCRSTVRSSAGVVVAQPQTYMNRSGAAVRCLVELYAVAPADVLVIYDEVQLPLGRLRLRAAGSPGGHRGMESVVEALQTQELPRLRLGIGAPAAGADLADFVLAPFAAKEEGEVEAMLERAVETVELWLAGDFAAAVQRTNRSELPRPGEIS